MATWLASRSVCHATRARPTPAERLVDEAVAVAEQAAEDDRHGDRRDHERQQHAHPPDRRAAQRGVEQAGEGEGDEDLRHRGEQEDADRVDGRLQEVRVLEDVAVVLQADELTLAADQAPVVDRDDRRVDEREHPDDQEQDEERRDVHVRREPDVPAAEALPPGRARPRRAAGGAPYVVGIRGGGVRGRRLSGVPVSGRHREARCSPIPRGWRTVRPELLDVREERLPRTARGPAAVVHPEQRGLEGLEDVGVLRTLVGLHGDRGGAVGRGSARWGRC